ncbi:MAG TPA: GYD domain-containing protein [Candidatus Binatia bacterium]|nr:GYD domain-containing protein [Candidatus Binatia bacterium]
MSKFLMQVSLTKDGAKGLAKDGGTKRKQAAEQFFKSVGGKLEVFYYAFGDTDVFAIVDFPDSASAAAISLAGNGAGQANVKATVLITPEEMDQAAKKSQGLRPPGA